MRRRVWWIVAGAGAILLAFSLYARFFSIAGRVPLLAAGAEERADFRSGEPRYRWFLSALGGAASGERSVLILVHDPARRDYFSQYRACHDL